VVDVRRTAFRRRISSCLPLPKNASQGKAVEEPTPRLPPVSAHDEGTAEAGSVPQRFPAFTLLRFHAASRHPPHAYGAFPLLLATAGPTIKGDSRRGTRSIYEH
jgi:hypothetical protein